MTEAPDAEFLALQEAVAGRVMVRDSDLVADVAPASIADHARALADWSRSENAP